MSKRFVLNRRAVLKGVIGSTVVGLALPTLEAMLDSHGTAYASGEALPKRFMSWFFGNGVRLDRFTPSGQGQGDAWELTEELQPLENVKDYVSILSGFSNKAGYGRRGHHDGVAGHFSGYPFIPLDPGGANYSSKFGGPSIDQQILSRLQAQGVNTYIPSLHVGVSKRVTTGEGPTLQYISHKGPDESIESQRNPVDVFNALFGNFVPKDDPEGPLRVAMLDVVANDAKRLKSRVGKADQSRLDAHLDSIAQLQSQISALPPACTAPTMPTETNDDQDGKEPLEAVSKVMADLVTLAWKCDITRVASWHQSGSVGGTVYWMTGATTEEHGLSHDTAGQELVHQAVVFNMGCFANLLETLEAAKEPDGSSLLDHSVVMLGSDCAEGLSHSSFDQPCILAGGGGGALKTGMHYRSPDGANLSNVLVSVLKAFDPSATEVGADEGYSNTALGDILA